MNKATAAALCAFLAVTPFLVLLAGVQSDAPLPVWQLPPQRLLEYARRQPGRLAAFATGQRRLTLGKVVQDTSTVVATLPDATVHAAGVALVAIKRASIEGFRTTLQGLEAGYFRSADVLAAAKHHLKAVGHILQPSAWPSYAELKGGAQGLVRTIPVYASVVHSELLNPCPMSVLTKAMAGKSKEAFVEFWDWIGPGGRLHPEEFLEKYYGHVALECLLAIVIGYLFIQRSFKWSKKGTKLLTEEEIDDLCEDWQPEPLADDSGVPDFEPPIISGPNGVRIAVNGKQALNMVAYDFLGIAGDPKITEKCKATINKYGLGACGPRGFYGTIDVHLDLETTLARFMGQEEAIIYSYDLSTIPSVLPAFANAKDLIIIDEMVDFTIQNGANLSRAKVVKFKHNNVEDLERVLQSELQLHAKLKKPLNRRFIVVEGIYRALGDLAPLDDIARLKHKYRFRLVVDESLALGTLGRSGRGACEHAALGTQDVDIICASMSNSLASVGGFCVGTREVVDHQRLSGFGYCFSAALPPYLATAAIGAVEAMEANGGQLAGRIQDNARHLRAGLAGIDGLKVVGAARDAVSPLIHVRLAPGDAPGDNAAAKTTLQHVVDEALKRHGVLFSAARVCSFDKVQTPPSIRITVTAAHTKEDIDTAVSAIRKAFVTIQNRKS